MSRQRSQRVNFQFNKGWNTEASPMTFPEGTAKDLSNVILDIDGSIRRRAGVNFDQQVTTYGDAVDSTMALGFNTWDSVAGAGNFRFTVSQQGLSLYFHIESSTDTLDNYVGTVDFTSFAVDEAKAYKDVVQVCSGLGKLFVSGSYIDPFYVEYNVSTETLSATKITIQIRDFDGIDEGVDDDERPSSLSNFHKYNLLNQGWKESGFPTTVSGYANNPIDATKSQLGVYPSNSDIMAYGKRENADVDDWATLGKYDPTTLQKNVFGSTAAPKGHYIFDAFNIARNTIVSGATTVTIPERPRAIAFHNGRVFYAGINVTDFNGKVYYSQQLSDIKNVGKCYQKNDPTAEEFNELLATDGGVLTIPGCAGIQKIIEVGSGIVILANSGIWQLSGPDGQFTAKEYTANKITEIGAIGKETAINADGNIIYWSNTGIMVLQADRVTGALSAQSLTESSIQTGYLLIGGIQQEFSKGVYIPEEKKAVWLYSTDPDYDGETNRFKYNGLLVFDMQLGAFYKYLVSDLAVSTPYISGIVAAKQFGYSTSAEEVTDGGVTVTDSAVTVVDGFGVSQSVNGQLGTWKLQCVRADSNQKLTMGGFRYLGFYDWYFSDGVGVDYSSYLETGYQL